MESYLSSLGFDFWMFVVKGYTIPITPIDQENMKSYEDDAQVKNDILCKLSSSKFFKMMHCQTTSEIWGKLNSIYEGDDKVK